MRVATLAVLIQFLFSLGLLLAPRSAAAQDSTLNRQYTFSAFNQYDLRNSSLNAISAHRLLHDGFRKGIKPHIGEKLGNVSYGVYSFAITYLTMLWSHEFGHSLRAAQVGGKFNIHNVGLPFPYTTMTLPQDISLTDEALSVTGGFEVNYLNIANLQAEFMGHNGLPNEDLALAFANRLMYPLYASVVVPIDPNNPEVWINTAGDPVHYTLPVFEKYSNGEVFLPDGSVNPDLADFYNQAALLASFFNLLDPQFYREVGATFGNSQKFRQPIFLIGDHTTGWTYGTHFNTSPLGYELYMNNYLHLNGQQFGLTLRYGRPFNNSGLGLAWNNIVATQKVHLGGRVDLWAQDLFGEGIATELKAEFKLNHFISISTVAGYKTKGYVLGKQIDAGANLGLALSFTGTY